MPNLIPMDFYPTPLPLTSAQKKRIAGLVRRKLSGKTARPLYSRRILIPVAVLFSLSILLGCTAANPEIRETVVQAVEKLLTREEKYIDPYANPLHAVPAEPSAGILRPDLQTATPPENAPAHAIGASVTGTESDVVLTLEKAILDDTLVRLKMTFTSPSTPLAGYLLQFDALRLDKSSSRSPDGWEPYVEHLYGERGIPASEVFTTLPEEPSHTVSVWFPVCGETLLPGTYRLRIERLFGVTAGMDAAGQYTDQYIYTEYGDFTVEFTLPEPLEPIPTTTLTPVSPFQLEGQDFTLESILVNPLYIEVSMTAVHNEPVCFVEGFEDVLFSPVEYLRQIFDPPREHGLAWEDYITVMEHGYELIAHFRDGITRHTHGWFGRGITVSRDGQEYGGMMYHIPTTEPITEADLVKLEMVRYDGEKSVVIWQAE
ncbi:MAG: hypothetical protein II979_06405 [Clostridia bacterium]|nr:hypothetical protein [Clostridia bacterium]